MSRIEAGRVILSAPLGASESPNRGGLRRTRPTLGLFVLLLAFVSSFARAAETIPPAPRDHFNDYAGIVSPAAARQLNDELTQFERTTSNQLVVAIFPHLQSDSSIEDYTVRVAQAWKVGTSEKKNGAVLFIFSQDRKLYVQVGYGLEGVLPDALCKQIIANEITPRFRTGDFTGGVTAGVHALIAATKGEYRGTGRTVADRNGHTDSGGVGIVFFVVFTVIILVASRFSSRRNVIYGRGGRISPWLVASALNRGSSSSWNSGGSSSNGGGSFSGGGGSFGGGGAGGSW